MAFISREEFLRQQASKEERRAAFGDGPRVGFFSLKDDGDEAVVRFCYESPDEFEILATHQTTVDGKFRRVNCIRDFRESVDKCPFCAAGKPVQQKFYIRLIEYTRAEDGSIVAEPKIWERPTSLVYELTDKFSEYGPLCDNIFKVKRNGKKGDMKTTYSINYANPNVYNSQLYPYDSKAFDGYNIIGSAVLDKSFDEMAEMVGAAPAAETPAVPTTNNSTPRRVTY